MQNTTPVIGQRVYGIHESGSCTYGRIVTLCAENVVARHVGKIGIDADDQIGVMYFAAEKVHTHYMFLSPKDKAYGQQVEQ